MVARALACSVGFSRRIFISAATHPFAQRLVATLRKGSLSAEGRFVRIARVALRQFVTLSSSQNVK
jgi:hypothetical protein